MSNNYEVGMIVEGSVVQIKPFGAFVQLDERTKGLVHISQVSHNFINDITDVIKEGDTVKVKIMSIEAETKKISLSIKETQEKKVIEKPIFKKDTSPKRDNFYKKEATSTPLNSDSSTPTFDELMKDFTRQSNDRFADLNKRQKRN